MTAKNVVYHDKDGRRISSSLSSPGEISRMEMGMRITNVDLE